MVTVAKPAVLLDAASPRARCEALLQSLLEDERDMRRARQAFRLFGVLSSVSLIVLPLILAMDVQNATAYKNWYLFAISAVGSIQALFQPALRATQRRSDWIRVSQLRMKFQSALYQAGTDDAQLDKTEQTFAQEQSLIWQARMNTLTEAGLLQAQHDPKPST